MISLRIWTNQLLLVMLRRKWLNDRALPQNLELKSEPKLVDPFYWIHKLAFDLTLDHCLPLPSTLPTYPLEFHYHMHTLTGSQHIIYPYLLKKMVRVMKIVLEPPRMHPRVYSEIPLDSTHARWVAPTSDSKLSKDGSLSPTSKAPTGLILASGKGRSGIFDKDWPGFVDRAHSRHSELTRAKVEYTLISMYQRVF